MLEFSTWINLMISREADSVLLLVYKFPLFRLGGNDGVYIGRINSAEPDTRSPTGLVQIVKPRAAHPA